MGDRAEFVLGISQQEVLLQVSAFVRFLSLSLSLSASFLVLRVRSMRRLSFICFCSLFIATDPSNVLSFRTARLSRQPPRIFAAAKTRAPRECASGKRRKS